MFLKKLLMGRLIWLLENIYIFERAHELTNMNRKLLTPVYNRGIDYMWFGKKYWFFATFAHGTFGKSTTWNEIVIAGKGVQSHLTPYCNAMFVFLALFLRFVRYLPW
jgi:hypothetical protein